MTFVDPDGRELQYDGNNFAMTKQSVTFARGSIKGDVSTTFKISNNSVNREILNYKGPQMTSQIAFVKQPFSRVNKGNIIDSGHIIIQSEDSKDLNCFYVSGNSNWIQLFEGLITELDFSGVTNGKNYAKQFTTANILATATEGIVFPFVDWCFNKKKGNNYYQTESVAFNWVDIANDQKLAITQFYPCFYLHSLVGEIFSQAGIKKEGNLFTDPLYKSLALTPVNGQLRRKPFKKVLLNGSSQTYSAGVGVYEKIKGLTLRQSDPSTWDDNNKRFTIPFQTAFTVTFTQRSGTATAVRLYKNGVFIGGSTVSASVGVPQTISTIDSSITFMPGDYVELYTTSTGSPFSAAFDIEYEIPENILRQDYIDPSNFLPPLTQMEVIRFMINFFGCSVYFDSVAKTISLTIIEKLKLEDAEDWSQYYLSHESDYIGNSGAHNYINWAKSSDPEIETYNKSHSLKFASGDVQTGNTLLDQKKLFDLIFAPSAPGIGFNGVYGVNIPLINLIDDGDPILFTSIALQSAETSSTPEISRFTTGVPSVLKTAEVVRITNGNGVNIGYYQVQNVGGATYEDIYFPFGSTDSGKIWRQKIEYQTIEPRIVTVKPGASVREFSPSPLYDYELIDAAEMTTLNYATFTKNFTGLPIDQWKNNLAIDNPDSGTFTDPTIKELYFNKIKKFIENPNIPAMMILPQAVYQRFKFDRFIYLKTEKLIGYFFVDSISKYVDSKTPVEVNLYML